MLHVFEVAIFGVMTGVWIGFGIRDDSWLPWAMAAVTGVTTLAGVVLAPAILGTGARK